MRTQTVVPLWLALIHCAASNIVPTKNVTEDLYKGKVTLADNVTLWGQETWQSKNGDQRAFAYYGYKYGKAGRFEHSVPNTDFTYLDDSNRIKQGHACHQLPISVYQDQDLGGIVNMHEDCLFLDVYVPPVKKVQEQAFPVLIWIHGGSFKIGSKDLYNASLFARAIDAVIVTVNYRLGPFGFLSTGDEAARGNWAIGDLKLALNWTLANIVKFGGDPSKISIVGHSAGGALTSALMLDDNVRKRVFAAVAMSGSILAGWTTRLDPGSEIKKMAATLGCSIESTARVVECLRTQPVNVLLNASWHVLEYPDADFREFYTPVLDNLHIPKHRRQTLTERFSAPPSNESVGTFISGYMADDSALFLADRPEIFRGTFNYTIVSQLVMDDIVATETKECPQGLPVKVKLILDYYNLTESSTPRELRKGFYKISTDIMFGVSTSDESILYANAGGTNQMYLVSYDHAFMDMGAFHFLEVWHMFRGSSFPVPEDDMNHSMSKAMHDYFRHVVHTGRAIGSSFGVDGNYLELNQQTQWVSRKQNFGPLLDFWRNLGALPCPPPVVN